MKARRVERPPLKTAGPTFNNSIRIIYILNNWLKPARPTLVMVASTREARSPEAERKKWTMCAEKSTLSPTEMTRVMQVKTFIVRPQRCMKPATSVIVETTQTKTRRAPLRLARKSRTVTKMAATAHPRF